MTYLSKIIFLLVLTSNTCYAQRDSTFSLHGTIANSVVGDSISLRYWPQYYSQQQEKSTPFIKITKAIINDTFSFSINKVNTSYIHLNLIRKDKSTKDDSSNIYGSEIIPGYLISPGDNIKFLATQTHLANKENRYYLNIDEIKFYGKNKYAYEYQFQNTFKNKNQQKILTENNWSNLPYMEQIDSLIEFNIDLLNSYKNKLKSDTYQVFLANIFGKLLSPTIDPKQIESVLKKSTSEQQQFLNHCVNEAFEKYIKSKNLYSRNTINSPYFIEYFIRLNIWNYAINKDAKSVYNRIKSIPDTQFREKSLVKYLTSRFFEIKNADSLFKESIQSINIADYKSVLENFYSSIRFGAKIARFKLTKSDNSKIELSDLKGKIIVMDFWFTGCGGCSKFYKEFLSKAEEHFRSNVDVVFLTISVDVSKDKWLKSIDSNNYTSKNQSNVINTYTEGQGNDHPIISAFNVTTYPFPVIIDRYGNVASSPYTGLYQNKNNINKLIEAISNIYYSN